MATGMSRREFVERSAQLAILAGLFAWELSQDNGDLLNAMNRGLGHRLMPGR